LQDNRLNWQFWTQAGILVVLVAFLYRDVVARLLQQWMDDPNFSHGFFVPLFSAFVIWSQRARFQQIPVSPHWSGLLFAAGALAVLVVGVLGAELFLSRASLVLLLGALAIYFLGWGHFRAGFFPWIFLFLMIPIPVIIFNKIAFPLQTVASKLATGQLQLLGVPVLREGNVIHLPDMALEVVEACSGIRSLMSLFTLAIIYGFLLETRISRRIALALAAIPIAVIANAWRVTGTGLLGQYWDPEKAQGFFHTFSGWIIFVISLALLFALHGLFRVAERWIGSRKAAAAPGVPS